jgi:hypothetical protein
MRSILKDLKQNLDLVVKLTYLIPGLSMILSVLYTATYWEYLGVDIIEYLTISHLLISSIEIFVYIILLISVAFVGMYLFNMLFEFLNKFINGYLILSAILLVAAYLIYNVEERLFLIAFIVIFAVLTLGLLWLLKGDILYKVSESVANEFNDVESADELDTEKVKETLVEKSVHVILNSLTISAFIIIALLTPILIGLERAKNVEEKVSYSYVNVKDFKGKMMHDVDKYILLGKVGENYFFRPDSVNSVLIKQYSDFKNLEIKKVEEGDSLSSVWVN